MARLILQTVDFASLGMKSLHSGVTTLHSMARKGTITRLYDAHPAFTVCVGVVLVLALGMLALVLATMISDRRIARQRNAYIPCEPTLASGATTVKGKL